MNMYLSGFPLNPTTVRDDSFFTDLPDSSALNPASWPHLSRYLEYHFQRDSFHSCIKDVETDLLKIRAATEEFNVVT